jgi:hypothetical protein
VTFADQMLVRLADPATRAAIFDATALEQIASAAYDTSQATLEGPYTAVFEEFELGLPVSRIGTAEGQWGQLGGSDRSAGSFNVSGFGDPVLISAFWRGQVVVKVSASAGQIAAVDADWVDVGAIDRAIVNALGALPPDPVARQTERRTRLTSQLKAAAADPDTVTDTVIDRAIQATGASSVNAFFERQARTAAIGAVQVTFVDAAPAAPVAKPLPIAAAIVVPDLAAGLARALADARNVRDQLAGAGLGRADAPGVPLRRTVVVVWIVPEAVFQDAAWPGANVAARRAAAGAWLAREGIGLAVTP